MFYISFLLFLDSYLEILHPQATAAKKRKIDDEDLMLVENNIDSDEVIEFELDKNMFCWGSTIHGELGLGGIEEEHVLSPREVDFKKATDIEDSKFIFFKQTVFCFKNANEQFKQQNLY